MKELNDIQTVSDCLGTWWGQIHTRNSQGLLDICRVSEDVAATLLNLVFNLELKNLNREKTNFPGIDLGDDTNKKAFQVTARKDTAKIKSDIHTFMETHQGRFPGGIRFLILSDEKPRISKPGYLEKFPGFDPAGDILNFQDLIDEIKKIYREDNPRFERIRDFLVNEFGPVQSKTEEPLKILWKGSEKYYRALRGPNGRFRYLRIADILLPRPQYPDRELETTVETDPGAPEQTAAAALPGLWRRPVKHAVIVGDGGMGKTVSLLHWWEKLLETGPRHAPIPVFIALNELNQVPEGKRENFILNRTAYLYAGNKLTPDQVEETMKTPVPGEENGVPSLVLLLDGFNEITVDKRELLLELNRLTEQCPGLQVVITSRYDMRGQFNWNHWAPFKLLPLDAGRAAEYLSAMGQAPPGPGRPRELMGNPMMLTLYAAAGRVRQNYPGTLHSRFKDRVETTGELSLNFMEALYDVGAITRKRMKTSTNGLRSI